MHLKGHAELVLTDVRTGEKEIIQEDNMFTNAIQELFNIATIYRLDDGQDEYSYDSSATTFAKACKSLTPIYNKLCDGIVLHADQQEENIHNVKIDRSKVVGHAGKNLSSDPKRPKLGTYNGTASGLTEDGKGFKYIWEFNTSQANGTINSLALTSHRGGLDEKFGLLLPLTWLGVDNNTFNKLFYSSQNFRSDQDSWLDTARITSCSYNAQQGNFSYNFFDIKEDSIRYCKIDTIQNIGLMEKYNTQKCTILKEVKNFLQDKKVYKYSTHSYAILPILNQDGWLGFFTPNNSHHIVIYDFLNEQIITECELGPVASQSVQSLYFYNNFIYSLDNSAYKYEKINCSTGEVTPLKNTDSNNYYFRNYYIFKNNLYTITSGGYVFLITDMDELKYIGRGYIDDFNDKYIIPVPNTDIDIRLVYSVHDYGNQSYHYFYIALDPMYNATINNLKAPLVKDENKTLKIEYTVTEVQSEPATV